MLDRQLKWECHVSCAGSTVQSLSHSSKRVVSHPSRTRFVNNCRATCMETFLTKQYIITKAHILLSRLCCVCNFIEVWFKHLDFVFSSVCKGQKICKPLNRQWQLWKIVYFMKDRLTSKTLIFYGQLVESFQRETSMTKHAEVFWRPSCSAVSHLSRSARS